MRGYPDRDPSIGQFRVIPLIDQTYKVFDISTLQYVGPKHTTWESANNAATAMNAEVKERC